MIIDLGVHELSLADSAEIHARLSVVFADAIFELNGQSIEIVKPGSYEMQELVVATRDQILRTKFERNNRELRSKLYERLLN